jgi:hypothetical protein
MEILMLPTTEPRDATGAPAPTHPGRPVAAGRAGPRVPGTRLVLRHLVSVLVSFVAVRRRSSPSAQVSDQHGRLRPDDAEPCTVALKAEGRRFDPAPAHPPAGVSSRLNARVRAWLRFPAADPWSPPQTPFRRCLLHERYQISAVRLPACLPGDGRSPVGRRDRLRASHARPRRGRCGGCSAVAAGHRRGVPVRN